MTAGNGESLLSAVWKLKNGIYQIAKELVYDTSQTLVVMGLPSTTDPFEIVSIGSTSTTQTAQTLSTNRGREETLEQVVSISVFQGGADDSQPVVEQRAFELLGMLENYLHYTDTTVGGVVRECFLTDIAQDSMPAQENNVMGRESAITGTFTAKARIGR